MKSGIAISLALIILSVSLKDLTTYAAFRVNQSYIAEYLCINFDDADLMCSGKCFLERSLEINKEKDQQYPQSNLEKKQQLQYDFPKAMITIPVVVTDHAALPCATSLLCSQCYPEGVFHPPKERLWCFG
ncbi:MAG: hypothetical protein AAGG75_07485 [Bacteroidota bacterium]